MHSLPFLTASSSALHMMNYAQQLACWQIVHTQQQHQLRLLQQNAALRSVLAEQQRVQQHLIASSALLPSVSSSSSSSSSGGGGGEKRAPSIFEDEGNDDNDHDDEDEDEDEVEVPEYDEVEQRSHVQPHHKRRKVATTATSSPSAEAAAAATGSASLATKYSADEDDRIVRAGVQLFADGAIGAVSNLKIWSAAVLERLAAAAPVRRSAAALSFRLYILLSTPKYTNEAAQIKAYRMENVKRLPYVVSSLYVKI